MEYLHGHDKLFFFLLEKPTWEVNSSENSSLLIDSEKCYP